MNRALTVVDRLGLFSVILVFWAVFVVFAQGFLSSITTFGLSRSIAITTVVGLAQMIVLSIGQMNLAVGAIGGMVGVATGWMMQVLGLPIWVAIGAGLLLGAIIGWLNGLLITRTGINSFIVTLGMGSVITGLVFILTKAEAFRDLPPAYTAFGKYRLVEIEWLALSPLFIIALVATGAIFLLYRGTVSGRRMLATGANERAARLSGVPVPAVVRGTHALSGFLAAMAGIMLVSRLSSALPSVGEDWLLPSFAAPIVGGTLLSGGAVSVVGTFLGAVLIDSVSVGLTLLNVPSFWIQLFIGLVLLLAVLLDRARTVAIARGRLVTPPLPGLARQGQEELAVSADVATGRTQGFGPALLNRALGSDTARLALLVAAGCAVLAMLKPNFLTDLNAYVLLRGIAITLIVAFAQLLVLSIGQLSLSVGAIGGMTAVLTGGMMEVWGFATPAAIGAGLLVGAAAGLVNGLLITRTGINGFVITLATASAFTGITIGLNNAEPFYNLPTAFVAFGQARLGPVPAIGVITILVTLALSFLFRRTVLGRQILAVGGNPRSAALSGIRVDPIIVITHTLSGLLSAIAAILLMARLGSAQPSIGSDWLLPSFAIPIVGGVALSGGAAPIASTVLAACLIALIENGLVLTKADPYWIQFLLGAIILGAVGLNHLRRGSTAGSSATGIRGA